MSEEDFNISFTNNGFIKNNHYQLEKIEDDKVVLSAEIMDDSKNPYGIPHGGFIFGLGDTAMGIAARNTGKKAVTLNANITFLRPAKGNYLKAEAIIVKDGKTTAFIKCNIFDNENRQIASMDSNYYYID